MAISAGCLARRRTPEARAAQLWTLREAALNTAMSSKHVDARGCLFPDRGSIPLKSTRFFPQSASVILHKLRHPLFLRYAKSLFVVTLLTVFYLAFSPDGDPLPDFVFADKLKHAAAFSVLGLLFWGGWRTGTGALFSWMFGIGLFIEAVQFFLPWREASGWDLLADGVGAWLAVFLIGRVSIDQS